MQKNGYDNTEQVESQTGAMQSSGKYVIRLYFSGFFLLTKNKFYIVHAMKMPLLILWMIEKQVLFYCFVAAIKTHFAEVRCSKVRTRYCRISSYAIGQCLP